MFLTGILFLIASLALLVWAIAVAFDDTGESTHDDLSAISDALQDAPARATEDHATRADLDAEDAGAADAASRRAQSAGDTRIALMA